MNIYTETLRDNLSVQLPRDLVTILDIEPGDTVIFQVKGNQARISGLELSDFEQPTSDNNPFINER
ncbi:AbrB/MazE/SpoVT family DNA-binding domain-containing protein [Seongchinamella unica]|uniref:AbrB/MazE/SpoVT family DNA-binding domain-containing protein n=1 Tax=Seongchinamella unica TaxID=2547392 RepID=A0A4R5LN87_9GAMM|nr:AbrB/MazE/SpoVT family DNA-binding domain-containing protein [Seongchinamella unica]TDG11630.1 AbrB/MazE/SpoVT family DNA-binding domain-containing protein [Seongchinamella unica]